MKLFLLALTAIILWATLAARAAGPNPADKREASWLCQRDARRRPHDARWPSTYIPF